MASSLEKLQGLRILVAEDETLVLMEIEDMLRELECEIVGPVSTVKAAVAAIRQNDLDGALLDMNLRGERVAPAAEELLARGVPFLLVTGYSTQAGDEPALKDAPRLHKPFTLHSLGAAMSDAFGSRD
jgi:DNA-binding NarL/FixJ family response regulator